MTKTTCSLVLAVLLLTAGTALADTVTFTGGGNVVWASWLVSPYQGTINGGPTQPLFCIDFNHTVNSGPWTANLTQVTPNTPYAEAAWIFERSLGGFIDQRLAQVAVWKMLVDIIVPPDHSAQLDAAIAAYQYAYPTVTPVTVPATIALAAGKAPSGGWLLVQDVNAVAGHVQWFLTPGGSNNSTVPEPASILLLGVVLVGCGKGLAKRWA